MLTFTEKEKEMLIFAIELAIDTLFQEDFSELSKEVVALELAQIKIEKIETSE
jgi:hypothetical protein